MPPSYGIGLIIVHLTSCGWENVERFLISVYSCESATYKLLSEIESVIDAVTDSVCDSVTDSVCDSVTDSVGDSVTESVSNSVTDSVCDSLTDSVCDSVIDSNKSEVQ